MTCDRCGGTEWEIPDPERHKTVIKVWGPDIRLCHNCGAVRDPKELDNDEDMEAKS